LRSATSTSTGSRGKPAARRAAEETSSLMKAAHEVCPYSNATRGNIDVRLVAE